VDKRYFVEDEVFDQAKAEEVLPDRLY